MGPTNGNRHPPDPDGQRVSAERAQVERFDDDALVKAELAQAASLAFLKRGPVDRGYTRPSAQLQLVERDDWPGHLQAIINNNEQMEVWNLLSRVTKPAQEASQAGPMEVAASPGRLPLFEPHHVCKPPIEESSGLHPPLALVVEPIE